MGRTWFSSSWGYLLFQRFNQCWPSCTQCRGWGGVKLWFENIWKSSIIHSPPPSYPPSPGKNIDWSLDQLCDDPALHQILLTCFELVHMLVTYSFPPGIIIQFNFFTYAMVYIFHLCVVLCLSSCLWPTWVTVVLESWVFIFSSFVTHDLVKDFRKELFISSPTLSCNKLHKT